MKLLIDIGNTMVKCGLDEKDDVKLLFRIPSIDINKSFLEETKKHIDIKDITEVVISSVVPNRTEELKAVFKDKKVRVVSPVDESGVEIKIDNPKELGTDLLCDLAGAKKRYGNNVLVLDLGTATKFLYLDDNGVFSSCAITPGIRMALGMMFNGTALLPDIDISKPKKVLDCHNTEDVLSSSAYYSHVDTLNGMVKRYIKEIGHDVKVVMTGGNSSFFEETLDFKFILDDNLCLYGLKVISEF